MEYIKNVTYTEYLTAWALEEGGTEDITIGGRSRGSYHYSEVERYVGTRTKLFEKALEHVLGIPPVVVTEIEYLTCARDEDMKIYRVEFKLF